MIIPRGYISTPDEVAYLDSLGVNLYSPVMDDSDDYEVVQDDWHNFLTREDDE